MFDASDDACVKAYAKIRSMLPEVMGEFDHDIIYEFELKVIEIYFTESLGDSKNEVIKFYEVEIEFYNHLRELYSTIEYEARLGDEEFKALKENDRWEQIDNDFSDIYCWESYEMEETIKEILYKYKLCYVDIEDCECNESSITNSPQEKLFDFEMIYDERRYYG